MQKIWNQKGGKYLFTALNPDSSSPSSPPCALQDRHTEFSKEEGEQKQICISLDLNFRQEPNCPTCHGNSGWTQTWDSGQKKKKKTLTGLFIYRQGKQQFKHTVSVNEVPGSSQTVSSTYPFLHRVSLISPSSPTSRAICTEGQTI